MEEIQVGIFVRTNLGNIGKVIEEYTHKKGNVEYPEPQEWVLNTGYSLNEALMFESDEEIVKCDFNIINILKTGDFIHTDYGWGWYHHKVDENTIVIDDGDEFIDVKKDEIHRILTQEMLWNNSYELKE